MTRASTVRVAGILLLVAATSAEISAQYVSPNTIATPGPVVTVLDKNYFVNQGLVGVGRIPASNLDTFGESFGSVSGLQVTQWTKTGNASYAGVFNILPDRGYNLGDYYADYAARIQMVPFSFTPYTGVAPLGGSTFIEKINKQNQIVAGTPSGVKLTYFDSLRGTTAFTTGLDPGAGSTTLFGKTMPYVFSFAGPAAPSNVPPYTNFPVNRLPLDSEALVLKSDGTGYVGDEYGAHVYYFDAARQIIGAITPPDALRPRISNTLNFKSTGAPTTGRRNNQGFEGVALSPDGSTLFVLLQSAAMQDSASGSAANRRHTRLLVYDVAATPTPTAPVAEYVMTLPTYKIGTAGAEADSTAAQSEVVALDSQRLLVLSRDANGLGSIALNPTMFKSILLVDLSLNAPTNIAGTPRDGNAGVVTTSSGVLDAAITPVKWVEAINMLNTTQLGKFNIALDSGTGQVSQLTLGEKWEGMSLVPALDPEKPNDYFLFIANDNDFLTSAGFMRGPDSTQPPLAYDAFATYPDGRKPANAGNGNVNNNDTMFLVFRVTFVHDTTAPSFAGMPAACSVWPPNSKMVRVASIAASDVGSGLAADSFHVTVTGDDGTLPDEDVDVEPGPNGSYLVEVRADRTGGGNGRTYTIDAVATDKVGNVGAATSSCIVSHDRRN